MKPHAFDPVSFAGGLLLVGLGLIAATVPVADLPSVSLLGPLVLAVLGLLLVGSAISSASRPTPAADPALDLDLDDEGSDLHAEATTDPVEDTR